MTEFQAAMLLHTTRQDHLLYDFVQQIVVQRWFAGERQLIRADVQRFLDSVQSAHPEVDKWSHSTREKLSRNMLTTLRDFGLLQGTVSKQIVEPIVPPVVVTAPDTSASSRRHPIGANSPSSRLAALALGCSTRPEGY